MKTNTFLAKSTKPNLPAGRFRTACAALLLPLLLLLALPAAVQAQFTYWIDNGTITITGYEPPYPVGAMTIPSMINGLPVTSIASGAFYGCSGLTSVTIPNSITSIGGGAFIYCSSLTSVTIPNGVTSIEDETFYGCYSLTNLTIGNGVTSIGLDAFVHCDGLTNVTIPDSVTSIGLNAFAYCFRLTSVTIGKNVASIGDVAFWNCTSLTGAYFRGNAPFIDSYVFYGDNKATVYYLPGTTGWSSTFGGAPTAPWFLPNPTILNCEPNFGVQTNEYGFSISWATNISVVVEACTDLTCPVWSPVATNTLTSGSCYFSDPTWTNYPTRFYRLRSP